MKVLLWICLFQLQIADLGKIRELYQHAPKFKQDAIALNQLLLRVDSNAAPVLICYKGANEMIQAKYAVNPVVKWQRFNKGKSLINNAIARDTLSLEMRFIRYSIQSNLPAFLNYSSELATDKNYLINNTKVSKDIELKQMIINYLKLTH